MDKGWIMEGDSGSNREEVSVVIIIVFFAALYVMGVLASIGR
jgi:hypothetical protein